MKKLILSLLLLGSATFAYAQDSTVSAHKTTLWKITSAQRTMYVTGAMNIPLRVRPVPKRIAQAFAQSGKLVMEGKVGPKARARVRELLKKYEPLSEGQTLADVLTDTQLRNVKTVLSAIGVSYNKVKHDQPWSVPMHISTVLAKKSGRKPHPRYRHFKHLAKQRHMPVGYLDTGKQEIEMLANMADSLKVAMLMQTVNMFMQPSALRKKQQAIKAWASGNIQSAAKHFVAIFKDYPGLYQVIVTGRHARWAKSLEAMLSKSGKPVFVVVGAPHLFGPNNLLDYLRKTGYQVSRL